MGDVPLYLPTLAGGRDCVLPTTPRGRSYFSRLFSKLKLKYHDNFPGTLRLEKNPIEETKGKIMMVEKPDEPMPVVGFLDAFAFRFATSAISTREFSP
jgi:hypothetical protein